MTAGARMIGRVSGTAGVAIEASRSSAADRLPLNRLLGVICPFATRFRVTGDPRRLSGNSLLQMVNGQ